MVCQPKLEKNVKVETEFNAANESLPECTDDNLEEDNDIGSDL